MNTVDLVSFNHLVPSDHRFPVPAAFHTHAHFQIKGGSTVWLYMKKIAGVQNRAIHFAVKSVIKALNLAFERIL